MLAAGRDGTRLRPAAVSILHAAPPHRESALICLDRPGPPFDPVLDLNRNSGPCLGGPAVRPGVCRLPLAEGGHQFAIAVVDLESASRHCHAFQLYWIMRPVEQSTARGPARGIDPARDGELAGSGRGSTPTRPESAAAGSGPRAGMPSRGGPPDRRPLDRRPTGRGPHGGEPRPGCEGRCDQDSRGCRDRGGGPRGGDVWQRRRRPAGRTGMVAASMARTLRDHHQLLPVIRHCTKFSLRASISPLKVNQDPKRAPGVDRL